MMEKKPSVQAIISLDTYRLSEPERRILAIVRDQHILDFVALAFLEAELVLEPGCMVSTELLERAVELSYIAAMKSDERLRDIALRLAAIDSTRE